MKLAVAGSAAGPALKCLKIDYFEFVPLAGRLGVAGLELTTTCVGGSSEPERRQWLEKMAAVMRQAGMDAPAYMIYNDFTQAATHAAGLENLARAIPEARIIGAPYLRIMGGSRGKLAGLLREEGLANVVAGLKQAVRVVEGTGLRLVLENHGDLPGLAEELQMIIEAVGSPLLGVCIDLGNFLAGNMAVKADPLGELEKLLPLVMHVHVKDRRFRPGARGDVENCVVGTGALPLARCLERLHSFGYDGFVSCESDGEPDLEHWTALLNSLANIKTMLERLRAPAP